MSLTVQEMDEITRFVSEHLYMQVGLNISSGQIKKLEKNRWQVYLDAYIQVISLCDKCKGEIDHTHQFLSFDSCLVKREKDGLHFEQFPSNERLDEALRKLLA